MLINSIRQRIYRHRLIINLFLFTGSLDSVNNDYCNYLFTNDVKHIETLTTIISNLNTNVYQLYFLFTKATGLLSNFT